MNYAEKLRDPRWQKKRLEVMQRDEFKCRDCGASDKTLHVHHCWYSKNPWDISSDYLLTVCGECHEYRDAFEGLIRQEMGIIFSRLSPTELMDLFGKISYFAASDSKSLVILDESTAVGLWQKAEGCHGG